jgi:hypothetical protein
MALFSFSLSHSLSGHVSFRDASAMRLFLSRSAKTFIAAGDATAGVIRNRNHSTGATKIFCTLNQTDSKASDAFHPKFSTQIDTIQGDSP